MAETHRTHIDATPFDLPAASPRQRHIKVYKNAAIACKQAVARLGLSMVKGVSYRACDH